MWDGFGIPAGTRKDGAHEHRPPSVSTSITDVAKGGGRDSTGCGGRLQDSFGGMTRLPESAPGTALGLPADRPNRWWLVALGVSLAIQLIVLYMPQAPAGPSITGLDKVVHVCIFAAPVLAALLVGLGGWWVLGLLAVHAPVSELIQHFLLPQRNGDVFDAVADLSGVLLGGLAYMVWTRRHP